MEAIPQEWVDKIFGCMKLFYGERWDRLFDKPHRETLFKTIWQNGLAGLTYDQVKFALKLCRKDALHPRAFPPHVMEFFRYAKGEDRPYDYENKELRYE